MLVPLWHFKIEQYSDRIAETLRTLGYVDCRTGAPVRTINVDNTEVICHRPGSAEEFYAILVFAKRNSDRQSANYANAAAHYESLNTQGKNVAIFFVFHKKMTVPPELSALGLLSAGHAILVSQLLSPHLHMDMPVVTDCDPQLYIHTIAQSAFPRRPAIGLSVGIRLLHRKIIKGAVGDMYCAIEPQPYGGPLRYTPYVISGDVAPVSIEV